VRATLSLSAIGEPIEGSGSQETPSIFHRVSDIRRLS
jgi:hypothetical protein